MITCLNLYFPVRKGAVLFSKMPIIGHLKGHLFVRHWFVDY